MQRTGSEVVVTRFAMECLSFPHGRLGQANIVEHCFIHEARDQHGVWKCEHVFFAPLAAFYVIDRYKFKTNLSDVGLLSVCLEPSNGRLPECVGFQAQNGVGHRLFVSVAAATDCFADPAIVLAATACFAIVAHASFGLSGPHLCAHPSPCALCQLGLWSGLCDEHPIMVDEVQLGSLFRLCPVYTL